MTLLPQGKICKVEMRSAGFNLSQLLSLSTVALMQCCLNLYIPFLINQIKHILRYCR